MKFLITGGAGFIGSHLTDKLIGDGHEVTIFDNLTTGSKINFEHNLNKSEFKFINESILDYALISKSVENSDHVIHLAAAVGVFNIVNHPLDSLLLNIHGTENVLKASLEANKEVMLASTSEIYGKNSSEKLNENSDRILGSPLISRWSYAEAKAIDESLAFFFFKEKGLKVRIVRFFNTVGPRQIGDYGMVIPRFVEAALRNEKIKVHGTGSQIRCFCHVYDAVDAVIKIILNKSTIGQVYNVGNDQEITISELAKKVKEISGSTSEIINISYDEAYGTGFEDMQKRVPDITKIKNELNWLPQRKIDQIITDVVNFQRQN